MTVERGVERLRELLAVYDAAAEAAPPFIEGCDCSYCALAVALDRLKEEGQ